MSTPGSALSICERDLIEAYRAWVAANKLSASERLCRPAPIAEVTQLAVARAQGQMDAYRLGLERISVIAAGLVDALDAETLR